jgi:hypothetical protein
MGYATKKKSNYAIVVWLAENADWAGHILDLDVFVSGDSPKAVLKEISYEIARNEKRRRS